MALAQCQLLGGHGLVALDQQRPEPAWQWLSAVPPVPSTTAASLGRRFGTAQLAGVESSMARLLAVALRVMPPTKRAALAKSDPTIDMDSTDVEVYGPRKQGVAFNYKGQRAGRPHLATWAQAGVTVAADLLAGNDDVRPRAADMLRRALAAIPAELTGRRRVRADAGCDYAIAAKRNTAMWRAYAAADEHQWLPARDMPGAQVVAIDHAPQGQPDDAHTVVRRVPVNAEDISVDPRTRRRRTIPAEQLTLPWTAHCGAPSSRVDDLHATATLDVRTPAVPQAEVAVIRRACMTCQCLQDGAQLPGLRGGIIIDVDIVLALPLAGRIGQEAQPRIHREAGRSKADQLLPRSLAGHDPARCRQVGTRCEHHTTMAPPHTTQQPTRGR